MRQFNFVKILILTLLVLNISQAYSQEIREDRRPAFAWGAGLVSNIDLSQHSMSSLGINAELGMRWKWIRFIGIGAEGDFMTGNSSRTYPLYINFKTDFKNSNQLLFMDIRGGIALNYIYESHSAQAYVSGGVGITLARGKSFASHIVLAYTYLGQDRCYIGNFERSCPGISLATLRLGICFQTEKR